MRSASGGMLPRGSGARFASVTAKDSLALSPYGSAAVTVTVTVDLGGAPYTGSTRTRPGTGAIDAPATSGDDDTAAYVNV